MNKKNKKKVKTLRLGYGEVCLGYSSSTDNFPKITLGEFIDKSKGRLVGVDCLEESTITLLALEFPNRDSIKLLREYLNKVEEYMDSEESLLEMYSLFNWSR